LLGREVSTEDVYGFGPNEGQVPRQASFINAGINDNIGGRYEVRCTVMAVDAIHFSYIALLPCILHKGLPGHVEHVAQVKFFQRAIFLLNTDPQDDLALFVGRDVVNWIGDMPVDALIHTAALIPSSHLQDEGGLYGGIGFVVIIMLDDFDDVIFEHGGGMTFLTGFAGRAQVVDRAFDRAIVGIG